MTNEASDVKKIAEAFEQQMDKLAFRSPEIRLKDVISTFTRMETEVEKDRAMCLVVAGKMRDSINESASVFMRGKCGKSMDSYMDQYANLTQTSKEIQMIRQRLTKIYDEIYSPSADEEESES